MIKFLALSILFSMSASAQLSTNTPNMSLPLSVIGVTSGLGWEQNVNTSMSTIDGHNHTPGKGVAIPTTGLNINANLPFNNHSLTTVKSAVFTPQVSLSTLSAIYVIGNDLYFNDGASNVVQITAGGAVNATSSGISSGTATASFVSSVLVVNADTNKPANVQGGSFLFGNNVTSSKFLTLSPPSAMANNISETLPSIPGATSFMTIDSSGNMLANITVSGGITQSNMANNSVGTNQLIDASVTAAKISAAAISSIASRLQMATYTTSASITIAAGVTSILVEGCGGGGAGGAAGNATGSGGGGGSGAAYGSLMVAVSPADVYAITIGTGGTGNSNPAIVGGSGTNTTFGALFTFLAGAGGRGGQMTAGSFDGGLQGAGGNTFGIGAGGFGGPTGANVGQAGKSSAVGAGGAAGATSGGAPGGGGGGAGGFGAGGGGGSAGGSGGTGFGAAAAANTCGGGGGGGRAVVASNSAGGAGGSGKVRVTWAAPP